MFLISIRAGASSFFGRCLLRSRLLLLLPLQLHLDHANSRFSDLLDGTCLQGGTLGGGGLSSKLMAHSWWSHLGLECFEGGATPRTGKLGKRGKSSWEPVRSFCKGHLRPEEEHGIWRKVASSLALFILGRGLKATCRSEQAQRQAWTLWEPSSPMPTLKAPWCTPNILSLTLKPYVKISILQGCPSGARADSRKHAGPCLHAMFCSAVPMQSTNTSQVLMGTMGPRGTKIDLLLPT